MWGLLKKNDVPPAPSTILLREFYLCFSNSEEVQNAISNSAAVNVVAQDSILTLRNTKAGCITLGRGLMNINNLQILCIHGVLARVRICVWASDLDDEQDSLYNNACRLDYLETFHQLFFSSVYNYMNFNLKFANSKSLMIAAYNHYVHFLKVAELKIE